MLDVAEYGQWILLAVIILLILLVVIAAAAGGIGAAVAVAAAAVAVGIAVRNTLRNIAQRAAVVNDFNPPTSRRRRSPPCRPVPAFQSRPPASRLPRVRPPERDSAQAAAFRSATSDLFTGLLRRSRRSAARARARPRRRSRPRSIARLDPVITVPRRTLALLTFASRSSGPRSIRSSRSWPRPSFRSRCTRRCAICRPHYVLPGVELVPPDTLGLAAGQSRASSRRYMVGPQPRDGAAAPVERLPDRPARQLLPPVLGRQRVRAAAERSDRSGKALTELLKDIPPIHTWPTPTPLGTHPNRTDIVAEQRGAAGARRAVQALSQRHRLRRQGKRRSASQRVLDDTDERYPIFRGTLPNDITFLGFNLSLADARGGTPQSPEGFFFVFQEQPSEPRFGLEPTEDANPDHPLGRPGLDQLRRRRAAAAQAVRSSFPISERPRGADDQAGSPWRLASQVFGLVADAAPPCPISCRPACSPRARRSSADAENPERPATTVGRQQRADRLHPAAPAVPRS